MDKEEKKKLVLLEERRLKRIFSKADPKKKQIVNRLAGKAAYQHVSLMEMQDDIDENGYYEKFAQGKDQVPYDRRRPVVDAYNSMTASYQKYMKQLADMLPAGTAAETSDGFDDFINGRKD